MMEKISADRFTGHYRFVQVDIGENVDGMWGIYWTTITNSDIEHLQNGGCLYATDGEYAVVIKLEDKQNGTKEEH